MKIVIAPQAFKGTISALEAAKAMSEGVRRVVPEAETDLVPVADGGDGTLETLVEITGGEIRESEVTGPLGHKVVAAWGALGDGETAVVEMARSLGLALVPAGQRNPLTATTYGLGEVILAALDAGFRRFIVGIGGSATNDAGAGMGPGAAAAKCIGTRSAAAAVRFLAPPPGGLRRAGSPLDTALRPPYTPHSRAVYCDEQPSMVRPR